MRLRFNITPLPKKSNKVEKHVWYQLYLKKSNKVYVESNIDTKVLLVSKKSSFEAEIKEIVKAHFKNKNELLVILAAFGYVPYKKDPYFTRYHGKKKYLLAVKLKNVQTIKKN